MAEDTTPRDRENRDDPFQSSKDDQQSQRPQAAGPLAGVTEESGSSERDEDSQPDIHQLLNTMQRSAGLRSLMLAGLFLIAAIFTMRQAAPVLMPITLAILLSFLLSPIVGWLYRRRIPEPIGAGIVVAALLGLLAVGTYSLTIPAAQWVERLPEIVRRIDEALVHIREPFRQVGEAAKQVSEMADMDDGERRPVIQIDRDDDERPDLMDIVFSQAQGIVVGAVMVTILLYFFLAVGDLFLEKLIRVQPRFEDKRQAVKIVHQIQRDISSYLLTITVINIGLGIAVGFAMYMLGIPNPILWGLMAAALNFIPYVGAMIGIIVILLVSLVTFDGIWPILLPPAIYLTLNTMEAYLFTPILLGQRLTLSPVVILVGLLFWSWLWGIPGALMAVPLLAAIKILCDQIKPLQPIGEFFGH